MDKPRGRRLTVALACSLLLGLFAPGTAGAQLFFSSSADSGFRIGPLILRAGVDPSLSPVQVSVLWSLVAPPGRPAAGLAQDLFLLWPGEIQGESGGVSDPALARGVEALGFDVIGEGRVALFARRLAADASGEAAEGIAGGAPYATFVEYGGALGLSAPATWVRIPWDPRLVDRNWLVELRMRSPSLVKPRAATWSENMFLGRRYLFAMSFNEVRDRPLFPMYLAHRDRVVRLADAPAELAVTFSHSDQLKIDAVFPLNSIRRLSETMESTQVVSLFLDTSEGVAPQQLAVHFGYFSRAQAWALVVIPALIFVLGNAVGPMLGRLVAHVAGGFVARIHWGGWNREPRERQRGVLLSAETLARIVPGQTTYQQVLALCGGEVEQQERLGSPGRRTLVYHGQRLRPQTRRLLGWLSTVRHLQVEHHEVVIQIEDDVVRDVQAMVRRSRMGADEGRSA